MNPETHLSLVPSDARGAVLHSALQKALAPPALPAGFRAKVLAGVMANQLAEMERRRAELELEHDRALAELRRGHVLLRRDTLALIAVSAFAAGSCAHLALPWLRDVAGLDPSYTVPLIALAIGAASGFSVWADRVGLRALLGMR